MYLKDLKVGTLITAYAGKNHPEVIGIIIAVRNFDSIITFPTRPNAIRSYAHYRSSPYMPDWKTINTLEHYEIKILSSPD